MNEIVQEICVTHSIKAKDDLLFLEGSKLLGEWNTETDPDCYLIYRSSID